MPSEPHTPSSKPPGSGDIGDFERAASIRRQANWDLSMSERLARVHELCKQIGAVKGAARAR
jgi:hypothetical protein